ncbi:MAG: hypothetical protein NC112_08665 [Oxalobacter formigenes]|nr:hypothetical protein [Oxalobacter formigenes]
MYILAHRGFWVDSDERNKDIAFSRAFSNGFGIETDVRDHLGELVVSHDVPQGSEMLFKDILSLSEDRMLAINVKSDGIAKYLRELLDLYQKKNYFVFDMSIPDSFSYINEGLPFFSRLSEVEPYPFCLEKAKGIWLDSFYGLWFSLDTIQKYIDMGKQVCVVSSELHLRDKTQLWDMLFPLRNSDELILCTDSPKEAKLFFN